MIEWIVEGVTASAVCSAEWSETHGRHSHPHEAISAPDGESNMDVSVGAIRK